MTTNFYQSMYEHVAFPIFVTNKSGIILYKNRAAAKHQPMIRKGVQITRRLFQPAPLAAGKLVHLLGKTPYPKALTFADEDGFLFICPPRLQLQDAADIAEAIIAFCGSTPKSLFLTYKKNAYSKKSEPTPRIYTDILTIFQSETVFHGVHTYRLGQIANTLFPKLTRSFRSLGYRIQASVDNTVSLKDTVSIDLFDFLFWTGKLLYLAMKLSQDKTIAIVLSSEPLSEQHILEITIPHCPPIQARHIPDLFYQMAPECDMEFSITELAPATIERTTFSQNDLGAVALKYHVPYGSTSSLTLRSAPSSEEYALMISSIFASIRKMLRENAKSTELL